jgi:hypothetical protein
MKSPAEVFKAVLKAKETLPFLVITAPDGFFKRDCLGDLGKHFLFSVNGT